MQAAEWDLSNVTAAVLAGGLGTRLRSVVSDRPKGLAEVGGRPFLAYQLDQLAAVGVRDVVLCTGYLGEQVEAALGPEFSGMRLHYSREETLVGTAGALRLALPLLTTSSVLVMNGDSYCRADFRGFASAHQATGSRASMLLTEVADTSRYGRVTLRADGAIERFEEKGAHHGPGWINAGIYLFARALLAEIPADRPVSLEREMFPQWLGRGFFGVTSDVPFLDIGTPESYAAAEALLVPR